MTDENTLFEEWRAESDPIKKVVIEKDLVKALRSHAFAVSWLTLRESVPELVNWSVFLALHNAEGFKGEAKFSTYFHTVVRNQCLNYLRDRKQKNEVDIADYEQELAKTPDYATFLPHARPADQELMRYVLDGLNWDEIGKLLKVKPMAALMRWKRLKQRMRRLQ